MSHETGIILCHTTNAIKWNLKLVPAMVNGFMSTVPRGSPDIGRRKGIPETSHWSHVLRRCCVRGAVFVWFGVALVTALGSLWSAHERLVGTSPTDCETCRPLTPMRSGAIVFLGPQRRQGSLWGIDRFCMLLRAIRSVDRHLNSHFGPYPIFVLVAKDHALDPSRKDDVYTLQDRALIRRWAGNSTVHFLEVNLYSRDALEPNTTRQQILKWRMGHDKGVAGRDLGYTSMCRLWSGRLQTMDFLRDYAYYLRMDDDSLLTKAVPFDPFRRMAEKSLVYAYCRNAMDMWGIDQLWTIAKPHLTNASGENRQQFLDMSGGYSGVQPYNNFHVTKVSFWKSPQWKRLWNDLNNNHAFYKYRVGDANVHAMALMMMKSNESEVWSDFPYVHNSNDYGPDWATKSWGEECQRDYDKWLM